MRRRSAHRIDALPRRAGAAGLGQGLFQALFGGFQRRAPEPCRRKPVRSPIRSACSATSAPAGEASGFGHGTVYCVRTCDGRYFPLQRHAGAPPAELCKSFCPAAKTMVFSGSKIDTAVAPNGTRYADLDNAFAYRDKVSDAAPATARTGSGSPASTRPAIRPCGRATSSPPTRALPPTPARTRPRNSRRSARRRANGRAASPR